MSDEKPDSEDPPRKKDSIIDELPPAAVLSPAAERNKDPILTVLSRVLPSSGLVVEIASGTGQHVVHFARALPRLDWQPSDPDPTLRDSIRAHTAAQELDNVADPVDLDVLSEQWPLERADAVLCSNLIHIAPWPATEGLLRGASLLLESRAPLIVYGPFMRDGRHTSTSNERFDASLKHRNPAWGIRDLDVVCRLARRHQLECDEIVAMPANNLTVILRKCGTAKTERGRLSD